MSQVALHLRPLWPGRRSLLGTAHLPHYVCMYVYMCLQVADGTPIARATGVNNNGGGWAIPSFIIASNTLIIRGIPSYTMVSNPSLSLLCILGLTRTAAAIGTRQLATLDLALRPRNKRLFNTVGHKNEAPRLIEVRPDGRSSQLAELRVIFAPYRPHGVVSCPASTLIHSRV
jgi:hypothetical protein